MIVTEMPRTITRPEHCIVGCGIPTSERAFRLSTEDQDAARRRFAHRYNGLLAPYLRQVIVPFRRLSSRFARLGVRVVEDLTLAGFTRLFGDGVHAVILFSHWDQDAVELSDGFADASAVVAATPATFDGCLDLCVCHPAGLMPLLRQQRPSCHLRWVTASVTPVVWLIFYLNLFRLLRRQTATYGEAQEKLLAGGLLERGRISRGRSS